VTRHTLTQKTIRGCLSYHHSCCEAVHSVVLPCCCISPWTVSLCSTCGNSSKKL